MPWSIGALLFCSCHDPQRGKPLIRLGGVPYGVGVPLLGGLKPPGEEPSYGVLSTASLIVEPPSKLITMLRAGEIDAALASSVESFRQPGYRIPGDLGICCNGPVRSVRAFLKPGVEEVRTVGLDTASETSVALLKILLARGVIPGVRSGEIQFERVASTKAVGALPQDLVMMIGDYGLGADPGDRRPLDLGELWHTWTGLPFVWAVWLIRPGADVEAMLPVFREARELGRPLDKSDGTGGMVYYEMTDTELEGFWRYRDEAVALGLAEPGVEPEILR